MVYGAMVGSVYLSNASGSVGRKTVDFTNSMKIFSQLSISSLTMGQERREHSTTMIVTLI